MLRRWADGDASAMDRLAPMVYTDLHRIAASYLREERTDHTLQPTALVNEAFVRLIGVENSSWQSRGHFFAYSSAVMRRILVDYARRRNAEKRRHVAIQLTPGILPSEQTTSRDPLLVIDDALRDLEQGDPRKARVIEMRYFGGMTGEEIAAALGIGTATVTRDLRTAEAWIRSYLAGRQKSDSEPEGTRDAGAMATR